MKALSTFKMIAMVLMLGSSLSLLSPAHAVSLEANYLADISVATATRDIIEHFKDVRAGSLRISLQSPQAELRYAYLSGSDLIDDGSTSPALARRPITLQFPQGQYQQLFHTEELIKNMTFVIGDATYTATAKSEKFGEDMGVDAGSYRFIDVFQVTRLQRNQLTLVLFRAENSNAIQIQVARMRTTKVMPDGRGIDQVDGTLKNFRRNDGTPSNP